MNYNLDTQQAMEVAALPDTFSKWQFPHWTKSGNLVLTGIVSTDNDSSKVAEGRIVMLDLNKQEVIFASPSLSEFVTNLDLQ